MRDFWSRLESGPCYIIAEAGVNHNCDLSMAHKLIDAAHSSDANAVKFQTFKASEIAVPGAHRDMLAKLEMPLEWYPELKKHADDLGIDFLSTPFDLHSAKFLLNLGVEAFKIGSGELTHTWLLGEIANLGLPMIISTGMSTADECHDANLVTPLKTAWLHCVSAYPAPIEGFNLKCMDTLRSLCCGGICNGVVGVSDHTIDDVIPIAAVAMGAQIIEKHITLDTTLPGPDHASSMMPGPFKDMVAKIRAVALAIGDGKKRPTKEEMATMPLARRVKTEFGMRRNP